jgi:hypothetical protein
MSSWKKIDCVPCAATGFRNGGSCSKCGGHGYTKKTVKSPEAIWQAAKDAADKKKEADKKAADKKKAAAKKK